MINNFKDFLNESKEYSELIENAEYLKSIYIEYKEVEEFLIEAHNEIYNEDKIPPFGFGFGFCNESKSHFTPLFYDIAKNLVKNDFIIDVKDLEETYSTFYFDHRIKQLINYLNERPYKKYYYYRTVKKRRFTANFSDDKFSPEEKKNIFKKVFKTSSISSKFDLSIDDPVSFINVELIEK
jgi:hypothetical protein